jgi:hypothetical protein
VHLSATHAPRHPTNDAADDGCDSESRAARQRARAHSAPWNSAPRHFALLRVRRANANGPRSSQGVRAGRAGCVCVWVCVRGGLLLRRARRGSAAPS